MFLRIIIASTFGLWIVLAALGKGGFVHLLLLICSGVLFVEFLRVYRRRLAENGR